MGLTAHIDRFSRHEGRAAEWAAARSDATRLGSEERTPELRGLGMQSAVAAPITVSGRVWGAIAIARRTQEPLPPTTEARLGDFAELAAQAIANADAREQLAASRTASSRPPTPSVGDRAQPARRRAAAARRPGALAAPRAGSARRVPRAEELLARASGEELQLALEELRELARGIHPAVLSDRGLDAALEALHSGAVPVDLTCRRCGCPSRSRRRPTTSSRSR